MFGFLRGRLPLGSCRDRPRRRGFTVVELLVVIGIVGVLLGLLMPGLGVLRRNAQNTKCLSNLRQLWVPIDSYMTAQRGLLPNCEFLPAASSSGPVGGLPALLENYFDRSSEAWLCPADFNEESLSTGTSYFYLPGLLKFAPEVQAAVFQMMAAHPPGSITQKELERKRKEIESRLVGALIRNDPKGLYPLLMDSEDRHGGGRNPRNGVYIDGSARELKTVTEEEVEEEAGEEGGG